MVEHWPEEPGVVRSNRTSGTIKTKCGCRIKANTSAFQAEDAGSIPTIRSNFLQQTNGLVAQLVEHSTDNRKVTGSIPVQSTKNNIKLVSKGHMPP